MIELGLCQLLALVYKTILLSGDLYRRIIILREKKKNLSI